MPIFSDWAEPESPTSPDHPNQLPNKAPATEFQYRYYLDASFNVDFLMAAETSLGAGAITGGIPVVGQSINAKDVSADWKLQLLDGQRVIFEQTVTVTMTLTTMAFSVFGALNMGFYTWAAKKEVINTTVIDGNDISTTNPAWSHTLGGTPLSEFGTFEAGSGFDYTDSQGFVTDWWDSPVYLMNVPVGTTLKVIHSAVQGGSLARNLRFQFRFIEAGEIDAFLDRVGAIRSSLPIRNHVYAAHTYYGPSQRSRRDDIPGASNPVSWKDRTNRMFWLALKGNAYYLWYSDTEGMEVLPVLYTYVDVSEATPDVIEGAQVAVWSKNYHNVDAKPRKQGGYITTAALGDTLYAAFSPDNRTLSDIRTVGPHDGKPCVLLVGSTSDGRARYILTDNEDLQYESTNGLDYKRVE